MRACVWISIAGAWGLLGCSAASSWEVGAGGNAGGRQLAQEEPGGGGAVATGGSAQAGTGDAGSAGVPDETAAGGAMSEAAGSGGMGPIVQEAGGSAGKPECTGTFSQVCPDVDGCTDPGVSQCVDGKWSECKCLDECTTGSGRECTTSTLAPGVQVCGEDRKWQECYPPPANGVAWPEHVLCHLPPGYDAGNGGVCILACYFNGPDYTEDRMNAKSDPPWTDHCVKQADGCWRCP